MTGSPILSTTTVLSVGTGKSPGVSLGEITFLPRWKCQAPQWGFSTLCWLFCQSRLERHHVGPSRIDTNNCRLLSCMDIFGAISKQIISKKMNVSRVLSFSNYYISVVNVLQTQCYQILNLSHLIDKLT